MTRTMIHIRRNVRINSVCLRDMGFWNLLSEVLSHLAVLRIRDWGSYYHLVSENPNAEHLVHVASQHQEHQLAAWHPAVACSSW